jgi:Zn-dependent protease
MFGKRLTLFKLFGFEVRIDLSWLVLGFLITWSLAKGIFPDHYKDLPEATCWWMGVAGAFGLFGSIVFHELSHSLVAKRFGLPMTGITLFIFGGVKGTTAYAENGQQQAHGCRCRTFGRYYIAQKDIMGLLSVKFDLGED